MMKRLMMIALFLYTAHWANPAAATCWQAAGTRYHIDPLLLYAIAKVESRLDPAARNVNRDGTYDIGLMQVNSRHLKRLEAFGINAQKLQDEPCTSVMTGAWILAEFIQHMGYGWEAVGAYNAGSKPSREALRSRYAQRVWAYYGELVLLRQQQREPRAGAPQ